MNYWVIFKFLLTGLISKVVQFLFNILFGPGNKDIKTNGCLCYDIWKDWKQHYFQSGDSSLFLLKYTGIKDITYIEQEKVSLYTIEGDYFVFVRTHQDIDIYDAEKYPFLYVSKHDNATEVIKVKIDVIYDYLRGTGKSERDGSNIAYLQNIGRCGSTLATTMVYKTKQCRVLSEPVVLLKLVNRFREQNLPITRDSNQLCPILKATLLLLSPDPDQLYFIKIHSMVMNLMPILQKALPGIKEIFMYRALKPTVTSFLRVFGDSIDSDSHVKQMFRTTFSPEHCDMMTRYKCDTHEKLLVLLICWQMNIYYKEAATRCDINAYRYEDLVKHKELFCERFFKDIGISTEFADLGLTALERDSQENSLISRDKTAGKKVEISQEALEFGKEIAEELGLEISGDDYQFINIDSTVTFK